MNYYKEITCLLLKSETSVTITKILLKTKNEKEDVFMQLVS